MRMSCSAVQHEARAWLERYFLLSGDFQPDSNEEIHLDPIDKKEVHAEYVKDVLSRTELSVDTCGNYLGYTSFIELWNNCFS